MILRFTAVAAALCACGDNLVGPPAPLLTPPLPSAPTATPPCAFQYGTYGVLDRAIFYTYDSDGFPTGFTTTAGDAGEYTYDENHFVLHFAYHAPRDESNPILRPELDYEETYTRDSDGRVLSYVEHKDFSIQSFTFQYDARGRLAGAGTDQAIVFYTYNGEDLNPSTGERRIEGTSPQVDAYAFTSSPDGKLLHADLNRGLEGGTDISFDMTFDDARRVTDLLVISYPDSSVTVRNHTEYALDGTVVVDNYATSDGADDVAYAVEVDRNGIWTATSVTSPNLAQTETTYLEVPADHCGIQTPRPAWPLRLLPPRGAGRALPRLPGFGTDCRHYVSIGC